MQRFMRDIDRAEAIQDIMEIVVEEETVKAKAEAREKEKRRRKKQEKSIAMIMTETT